MVLKRCVWKVFFCWQWHSRCLDALKTQWKSSFANPQITLVALISTNSKWSNSVTGKCVFFGRQTHLFAYKPISPCKQLRKKINKRNSSIKKNWNWKSPGNLPSFKYCKVRNPWLHPLPMQVHSVHWWNTNSKRNPKYWQCLQVLSIKTRESSVANLGSSVSGGKSIDWIS